MEPSYRYNTGEVIYEMNGYVGYNPLLMLVTSKDEITRLDGRVSLDALNQIKELDFGRYFVIAIFRGGGPTNGFDTIIERVVMRDNNLLVYAQLWEPGYGWEYTHGDTHPYHVIKVRRDNGDSVNQSTELVLQALVLTPTPPGYLRATQSSMTNVTSLV